jgi:hypothetical protein
MSKPKLKLIVEMCGGTICNIYSDNQDVEVTDIIFLEDPKEVSDTEDEFFVTAGSFKDKFVYTHFGNPQPAAAADFAPVVTTAEERIRQSR